MPTMQSKLVSRTIWLEKKKIWKINIQKNGIRKSFYSSTPGDKGRKICAQNAASWLSGSCPFAVSDHTTVETVFERYLKDKELETTNIYTIRNRYNNHIKPIIGKIPVMLLTKQDLKRVIYTAYRKCDLSQKSLKNIRGDLSGFCNYLDLSDIRNDLRTNNIRIPSTAKKGKKQALDIVSLDILFSESQAPYNGTVCQDSLIYAYRFNVVTGMRTGELMGLEWGDIDDNYIHIRRAINAKGITTSGKNEFKTIPRSHKSLFSCALRLRLLPCFLLLAVLEMMCFRLCFVLLSMLSMPLHGWQSVSELFSYLAICLIVGHIMTILRARASITKHAKRRY